MTDVALSAPEVGELLALPADVVRALADAGYVASVAPGRFTVDAVESFRARLHGLAFDDVEVDPSLLLASLSVRSRELAEETLVLVAAVYPVAAEYTAEQREEFIAEAVARIEAVISLCARGPDSYEAIELDMAEVGEAAAHAGVPLPGILALLRITRDLVVQTAIETAEARGRNWGLALSVTLTRVLPAIDRLSDAIALGYREATLEIEAEGLERYRNLVEHLSEGIFGVDGDGIVEYVNPALCLALRTPSESLVGRRVADVLGVEAGETLTEISVDGSSVRVQQVERLRDGVVVGWDGVVHRPS